MENAMFRSLPRPILFVLICPALMASKCRKPPETAVLEDLDLPQIEMPTPELELQFVAIDPDTAPANSFFDVRLYGSGFEEGATVEVGGLTSREVSLVDSGTLVVTLPPLDSGVYDVTVVNPDESRAVRRAGLEVIALTAEQQEICRSATLHFGYDSSALQDMDKEELEKLGPCFLMSPDRIVLEGHTDERGSTTYNLALGQQRADAVESTLVAQGLAPSRMRSMSFGEERPVELGETEEAWQENRRVELKVIAP